MDLLDFMPHGVCWRWDWRLLALHVPSDLVIFAAYIVSPALMYKVFGNGHRKVMPASPKSLWVWCAAFVFLCGLTHLGSFFETWFGGGVYFVTGVVKAICALVSARFTWLLWREHQDLAAVARALERRTY